MTNTPINQTSRSPGRLAGGLAALLLLGAGAAGSAYAQSERPGPAAPQSQAKNGEESAPAPAPAAPEPANGAAWVDGRRPVPDDKVMLGFKDEPLGEKIFSFIAETTGKVVMPVNLLAIQSKKINLINDEYIDRAYALDLLFQAFRLNGIGVIEKEDVIIVGNIDEIVTIRQMPVLTAEDDITHRMDKGSLVLKIFQLREVKAEDVGERIGDNLPSYATISVDPNSNQIIVMGDIALIQHLEKLITELDHNYVEAKTQTFRLAYADATDVSENILELFEGDGSAAGGAQPARPPRGRRGQPAQPVRPGGTTVGPEIELRVTVSTQQNSLTVVADPNVVDEIARLIEGQWDLPRSPGTSKIYNLVYTDPLKVAEKLNSLLGQGGGGASGGARGGARGGAAGGGVDQILQGIYRIEPYPDTSQLLVFCKTEESLTFLDQVISDLDQPTTIGLPFVSELKHASAIELAEELNALLSEAGAGATIDRPGEGLSGRDSEEGAAGTADSGSAGTIDFPWQRGGRQRDDQSPESSLIGKVRIVPIVRQNALAVLCPAPQREAVQQLIRDFDRPGRQVMISAVIAAVDLNEDLNLGIRFSNSDDILGGANPDYRLGGVIGFDGQNDPAGSLFDSSILNVNIGVNAVIQALAQNTDVRILQEPVVFTADNQEAIFFDGQDIPFISNTTINSQGNPTDSFEYKEVGVTLNVRPRITVEHDVDLEVLLELSNVVPGVTLFGGAIIDRRETRTHVIVQNGQTIVISGILENTESKILRKVPLLGDLPFVGELFKSRDNTSTTKELIAFITPQVVENPSENNTNFQEEWRRRLDELSLPVSEQAKERKDNPRRYIDSMLPKDVREIPPDAQAAPPPDGSQGRRRDDTLDATPAAQVAGASGSK